MDDQKQTTVSPSDSDAVNLSTSDTETTPADQAAVSSPGLSYSGTEANPSAAMIHQQAQVPQWLKNAGVGSWSLIGVALVIVGVVFATSRISAVFIAVFVAFVFTAILNPAVNFLAKHMPRGFAVVVALLSAIAVFAGLITFVVTSVAGQWDKLYDQLANGLGKIVDFLNGLPFKFQFTTEGVLKWLQDLIAQGEKYLTENWQRLATTVMSNAGGIAIFFTIVALAVFVTVFFLLQGSEMWRWFLNMLPTAKRGKWNHAAQAGWWAFEGYARGTMIIAFIDGVLAWVFLEILRVPLAPALAVLVMVGALIPMIGAPAAMALAMVVALATDGVGTAVIVGIGIAGIGQLEGHVLEPLIMGKQVALNPVVVGLGVISGTLLAGLFGAIIAIPIIGVVWAVFNALYHRDPPIEGPLPGWDAKPEPVKAPGFFGRIIRRFSKKDKSTKTDSDSSQTDEEVPATS